MFSQYSTPKILKRVNATKWVLKQNFIFLYNEGIILRGLYWCLKAISRYVGGVTRNTYLDALCWVLMQSAMKDTVHNIYIQLILYSWMPSSWGCMCFSSLQILKHENQFKNWFGDECIECSLGFCILKWTLVEGSYIVSSL